MMPLRSHKYCILLFRVSLIAKPKSRLAVSHKFSPPLTIFILLADVGEDVDMCVQRLLQAADYDPYYAG